MMVDTLHEIASIDLFAWLNELELYPKIYWANRDQSRVIAAAGIKSQMTPSAARFGWRHFIPTAQKEWSDFPSSFFFVPKFFVIQQNNKTFFSADGGDYSWKNFQRHPQLIPRKRCQITKVSSLPSRQKWDQIIDRALRAIDQKSFEKVVVARRVKIECASLLNPIAICQSIRSVNQTVFLIQPTSDSAFLGTSPEMLYQRRGRKISCDVLAGTQPICQKDELSVSAKEQLEFTIVQRRIQELLAPLCQFPASVSEPSIAISSQIAHLYSQITALLKDKATDEVLLETLHPTPAVGGYPSQPALAFLRQNEPFARGLYAAPIGWVEPESADFAVGIRSCLIQHKHAYLFAGTGIVAGSVAEREWMESELKLSQCSEFFQRDYE